jgi:hypothetical protein
MRILKVDFCTVIWQDLVRLRSREELGTELDWFLVSSKLQDFLNEVAST